MSKDVAYLTVPESEGHWDMDVEDREYPADVEKSKNLTDEYLRQKVLTKTLMDGSVVAFCIYLHGMLIQGIEIDPYLLGACFVLTASLGDLDLMKRLKDMGAVTNCFFRRLKYMEDPSPYEDVLYKSRYDQLSYSADYAPFASALYFACCKGHLHVVEYLVESLGLKDSLSAFGRAITCGHTAIVDWMLERSSKCLTTQSIVRGMHAAAFTGDIALFQRLMMAYHTVTSKDFDVDNLGDVLWVASSQGKTDFVRHLLSIDGFLKKLDPEYNSWCDFLCMVVGDAAAGGHLDTVRLLTETFEFVSPSQFEVACEHEHFKVVHYLLSVGDVYLGEGSEHYPHNLAYHYRYDPKTFYHNALLIAIRSGKSDVVNLILRKYPLKEETLADKTIKVALEHKQDGIFKMLIKSMIT